MLTGARATGIELVGSRHDHAVGALSRARADGCMAADAASRVSFTRADATAKGVIPTDATHAFFSNLCYPEDVSVAIFGRLGEVAALRCVLTLRTLPTASLAVLEAGLGCAMRRTEALLPMTWSDAISVYNYCCARPVGVRP